MRCYELAEGGDGVGPWYGVRKALAREGPAEQTADRSAELLAATGLELEELLVLPTESRMRCAGAGGNIGS